jgi:hypothetical protein
MTADGLNLALKSYQQAKDEVVAVRNRLARRSWSPRCRVRVESRAVVVAGELPSLDARAVT